MSFSPEQIANLSAPLDRARVKSRKQGGGQVSYIESWHAEAEANRIFGFDSWDSTIKELRKVAEREVTIGKGGNYEKPGWSVSYVVVVTVTVYDADGETTVREGVGAGHGIDADLGQAHESAVKEAASDAEKRALKTFGNQFGLALYDKTQANVADAPPPSAAAADFAIATMRTCKTADEFKDFWGKNKDGLREQLSRPEYERVVAAMQGEAKRFAPAPAEPQLEAA